MHWRALPAMATHMLETGIEELVYLSLWLQKKYVLKMYMYG